MDGDVEVDLLASDSMGVRSMAAVVNTRDLAVLIDPGAALGPLRYGLPPTALEIDSLEHFSSVISENAAKADALVISHYHYDHYTPSVEFFRGKKVFMKDVCSKINRSQKKRGGELMSMLDGFAECVFSDGMTYEYGATTLSFSFPVPHGPPGTRLGYVIMTSVSRGRNTVVHTSDIEGMLEPSALEWIIEMEPTLIIADGPPVYLLGYKFSADSMKKSLSSLQQLLDSTDSSLILDHHLLRSLNYRERMAEIWGARVTTFAGYAGTEEALLEARRKELHAARGGGSGGVC